MMLTAIDPPTFSPPKKNDIERLRNCIDSFVRTLGDDFPMQTLGRALMAKAAQTILEDAGMMQAIWSVQRIEDLLAGRFTDETLDLFIKKSQPIRKRQMDGRSADHKPGARGFEKIRNNAPQKNQNQGASGFSTPGPCGFAKAGGRNVSLSTDSHKPSPKSIYGQAQGRADTRPDIRLAGTRAPHILGKR